MPATGNILLDTSVVVAVLRRVPGVKERLSSAEELLVPLVALGELEYGANLAAPPERQREAVRTFMEGAQPRGSGRSMFDCTQRIPWFGWRRAWPLTS